MQRELTILLILWLGLPRSLIACLWDRDTPSDEARGMPEVVAVLTGRFVQNPPLYYEMRLARVTEHLRTHSEDIAAYDDAGVACDRLGRGDEAISWMDRKRAQLDALDDDQASVKEHRYRYHANLGTFLVHRWARQGADRSRIDEVKAARDQIALALEINPEAHFGREIYQLRALDWIIAPPSVPPQGAAGADELPNLLGWSFQDIYGEATEPQEADDAVRGLAGLVVLGNAWESVDVFHALNVALQRDSVGYERGRDGGRNTLAYFAWLRCRELIDDGKRSMLPDAPTGEALKSMLPSSNFVDPDIVLDSAFARLRAEADAWHAARDEFMMRRLKAGLHPDTDPEFWEGYTEPPAPTLPTISVPDAYNARQATRALIVWGVLIGLPILAVILLALAICRRMRRAS